MLAKVLGVYRLSKDVELRYLNNGTAVAKLSLVNSSKYKNQAGEMVEDTCFIDGTIFGKLSEVANQWLHKGSQIFVDAELKQENWEDQQGNKKSRHTLKINSFEMLGSKQDNQQQGQNQQQRPQQRQEPKVVYEAPSIDVDFEESIPF